MNIALHLLLIMKFILHKIIKKYSESITKSKKKAPPDLKGLFLN